MTKKQTDNQIIEEFEKEFSRIHRNGKDIGKHEPKWFFPEHITPRIVSDWLRPVLADQDRISRESERQKIKKLLLEKGNGGGNWRRIIISIIK